MKNSVKKINLNFLMVIIVIFTIVCITTACNNQNNDNNDNGLSYEVKELIHVHTNYHVEENFEKFMRTYDEVIRDVPLWAIDELLEIEIECDNAYNILALCSYVTLLQQDLGNERTEQKYLQIVVDVGNVMGNGEKEIEIVSKVRDHYINKYR